MRFQVVTPSILLTITSALLTTNLRGQAHEPQLSDLTRGATHESRTFDIPGVTAATSLCPVSDDPTYGVTPENPIKVGGGAMQLVARSMRLFQALRGPSGQGLHFTRLGSFEGPDGTILDVYQVERDGTVRYLYVDGYRSSELKAPRDLVCGASIQLDPPGPVRRQTEPQLVTLATTLDPAAAGSISLDLDGSAKHGIVFDHVRLVARAFATAAATGHPLDSTNVPSEINRPHFVLLAYPLMCDGRETMAPQFVKVSDALGNSPKVVREARDKEIQDLAPGLSVPASALAIMYDGDLAVPGQVEIAYGTACGWAPSVITLPLKGEAGRITRRVAGHVPDGIRVPAGGAQVRVQVYFDFDGLPHLPMYAGGPALLADAAVAAVAQFRAEPPRVNGAPMLKMSMVGVAFEQ